MFNIKKSCYKKIAYKKNLNIRTKYLASQNITRKNGKNHMVKTIYKK